MCLLFIGGLEVPCATPLVEVLLICAMLPVPPGALVKLLLVMCYALRLFVLLQLCASLPGALVDMILAMCYVLWPFVS